MVGNVGGCQKKLTTSHFFIFPLIAQIDADFWESVGNTINSNGFLIFL